jgi:hypothetical protein
MVPQIAASYAAPQPFGGGMQAPPPQYTQASQQVVSGQGNLQASIAAAQAIAARCFLYTSASLVFSSCLGSPLSFA